MDFENPCQTIQNEGEIIGQTVPKMISESAYGGFFEPDVGSVT
jgi:hypothetical protein